MVAESVTMPDVTGMPGEKRAVVHLETLHAIAMMIRTLRRDRAVEVPDDQPPWIAQNAICFSGNLKQIVAIAEIQAKSKYYHVKGCGLERHLFRGPLPGIDAQRPHRVYGLRRRIKSETLERPMSAQPVR